MQKALRETLLMIADTASVCNDPWWVIASAAVALHGGAVEPRDVDVLISESDAHRLCDRLHLAPIAPEPDPRFRSAVFIQWTGPPLVVEFMAGFDVHGAARWQRLKPSTRQSVPFDPVQLFVPERDELIAMLRRFGRPKDLARAALLEQR